MSAQDKLNDLYSHLKAMEASLATGISEAKTKVKDLVGDVNGDGKIDLKDVVSRVETSKLGVELKAGEEYAAAFAKTWTLRDSKVLAAGAVVGYVVVKLWPVLKPLFAALF